MRNESVLEAWEFGDPVDVVARREARERGQAVKLAKRRETEQRMNQRRIKALVAAQMKKARPT